MITTANIDIQEVMNGLGFEYRRGFRYWGHPLFEITVEFPPPPLQGDPQRISIIELDYNDSCFVIGIEDIILERIEELSFWQDCRLDSSSAIQLRLLFTAHRDRLDFSYLHREALRRDVSDSLELILNAIDKESSASEG